MTTTKRGPAPITRRKSKPMPLTITFDVDKFDDFVDKLEHAVDLQYGNYHFSARSFDSETDADVTEFLCITPELA